MNTKPINPARSPSASFLSMSYAEPAQGSSFPVERRIYFHRGERIRGESVPAQTLTLSQPRRDPLSSPMGIVFNNHNPESERAVVGPRQALASSPMGDSFTRRRPGLVRAWRAGVGDLLTVALIAALMIGAWIA